MITYVLDTNIASAVIRGRHDLGGRLGVPNWCISSITRAELRFGVALQPQATKLARLVQAFLDMAWTAPRPDPDL